MRLFAATLATETNTFSPLPTSLEAYKEGVFLRPGEHPDDAPRMCTAPLFVARAARRGGGLHADRGQLLCRQPGRHHQPRATTRLMRDEILDQLRAAMPVDGVLLGLHGAMVAYGYDDVEGDIIERARAIVGKDCVIGVELDPHCHMTLKRVARRRHHRLLQGIPAHRRGRARRGGARSGAAARSGARSSRSCRSTTAGRSRATRRPSR